MNNRGNFATKLGIVLATAGSAVGLGNVWRFPYMTGQNGGAAFLLIYVVCLFMLGIPGMLCEFIVGRHGQSNAVKSYDKLSQGKPWRAVGYLGIITSTIILGFYAVVSGWCLEYLFSALTNQVMGDSDHIQQAFKDFSSNPVRPVAWGIGFILITHLVIIHGVQSGIEKVSKWLMPLLMMLLMMLVVASCMLPGAVEGIKFLFMPDFSKINGSVVMDALGQAFFSLSLGTACLCTYASYFSKETNLLRTASQIAVLDMLIALFSGMMIFPAAASAGISVDSGPSLIFITLPNVFNLAFANIPLAGYVSSVLFYALLVFAALTSTISMHEIGTAFFIEKYHLPRSKAAWILTIVCSVICVLCSWSVGAYEQLKLFGLSLMDFCDHLTANYLLLTGGLLACLFVGWFIPKDLVYNEFTNGGTQNVRFYRYFLISIRYICPIGIFLVFLHQMGFLV